MTINYINKTIELTATEAKAAGKTTSEKYQELTEIRTQFPTYEIVVVKTAKKKSDGFGGLTYAKMEKYIKAQESEETVLETFYKMTGRNEDGTKDDMIEAATYGQVKTWFLAEYPEVDNFYREIITVVEKAKKVRAARKAA